ncbi:hypothetical protein E2C01_056460 [Portunus trituberculatus]|uniref:Uncharacterized protein n=1 Tax=Portunus trituberculatus TaxID=210409 RepID=A0A5B7GY86_PORTR|nr:hypothetical protein [Portunus trituberculatus]
MPDTPWARRRPQTQVGRAFRAFLGLISKSAAQRHAAASAPGWLSVIYPQQSHAAGGLGRLTIMFMLF